MHTEFESTGRPGHAAPWGPACPPGGAEPRSGKSPTPTRTSALRVLLVGLALLGFAGCASLPQQSARVPSQALALDGQAALSRMTREVVPPGKASGFAILPVSSASFATRIELVRHAEHSLDLQYYLLEADGTGLALMRALRDAALRGVRVRILIDDLYTAGEDSVLAGLAAYPNVEIRLFNPFVEGRGTIFSRLLLAADDSARINHRMHNKMFIADGTMAITGGRNIGDEYFMQASGSNFVDIDLFMAGPVVGQLESIFDTYWNCPFAYPVAEIAERAADPTADRVLFDARAKTAEGPAPEDLPPQFAIYAGLPRQLAAGHLEPLTLAYAEAFADPVDKAAGTREDSLEGTVTAHVLDAMNAAEREVRITSPYFVPGDSGVAMMRAGHARGGHISVLTNSLASTDAPAAYAGYSAYREAILKAGVELRELSPTLARTRQRLGNFGASMGSLHAKVVTIDEKILYMGSMNLDSRSAHQNTEVGVLIYSAPLVKQVDGLMDEQSLYHLRLAADGHIQWVVQTSSGEEVFDTEPETSWWLRAKTWLLSVVVPDSEI